MTDKITLKALTAYEKATGGNAFEMLGKETKTATDLVWHIYMVKYSADNTVTLDQIEALTVDEFGAEVAKLNEQKTDGA